MSPVLCNSCESSDHDVLTCPFHAYVDVSCANVEKKINELTDKIIENLKVRTTEYSHSFNQSRENYSEPNSSLGSPKHEVSLYDDFKPSYLARPDLNNDMPLPSVAQEGTSLHLCYKTLHLTLAHLRTSLRMS